MYTPEAGEYDFKVDACDKHTSRAGGTGAKITILAATMDAPWGDTTVYDYLMYQDNMKWKLKQLLAALPDIKTHESGPYQGWPISSTVVNAIGRAKFRVETWQGKDRLKVDEYLPAFEGGKSAEEVHADDVPF